MNFAVMALGPDEPWQPLLASFLRNWDTHMPNDPLWIVTDPESDHWALRHIQSRRHCRLNVNAGPNDRIACINNLERAGVVRAMAVEQLAPVVVMELDCELLQPFDWVPEPECYAALAPDPNPRKVLSEVPMEYNTGVLYARHPLIGTDYLETWMVCQDHEKRKLVRNWDQLVWSDVVTHAPGFRELPIRYNFSRQYPDQPGIVIRHWHGPEGKRKLLEKIQGKETA